MFAPYCTGMECSPARDADLIEVLWIAARGSVKDKEVEVCEKLNALILDGASNALLIYRGDA